MTYITLITNHIGCLPTWIDEPITGMIAAVAEYPETAVLLPMNPKLKPIVVKRNDTPSVEHGPDVPVKKAGSGIYD